MEIVHTPELLADTERLPDLAVPLLGAPSIGGTVKGFLVSKLGQVRGSEACLGDPGRGQLTSLLYSPAPSLPQAAEVAGTRGGSPAFMLRSLLGAPAQSLALLWLKAAAFLPDAVGPEAGEDSTSSKV